MIQGLNALLKTTNAALHEKMTAFDASLLGKLVTRIENDGTDVLRMLGATPRMQEMKGSVRPQGLLDMTGPTIANMDWEVSMDVNRRDLSKDSLLGIYKSRIQEMANEIINHPLERALAFIDAGHATTYGLAYDGQLFFDDDHVDKGAKYTTSQVNYQTTNIGDPAAPTLAEFEVSFRAMRLRMAGYKDDQGRSINGGGKGLSGLCALIPYGHLDVAEKLFNSQMIPANTASTTGSVTNPLYKAADIWAEPALPNTDRWFLLRLDRPTKPLILQFEKIEGKEWRVEHTPIDSDQAVKSDIITFVVKGRYNLGYGQWRYAHQEIFT